MQTPENKAPNNLAVINIAFEMTSDKEVLALKEVIEQATVTLKNLRIETRTATRRNDG